MSAIPVIDVSPLVSRGPGQATVATEIRRACTGPGFFYSVGHRVDEGLQAKLEHLSRQFFSQQLERKMAIRMQLGGCAWRGYFPVGDEMTSGTPDRKEGLYFGAELDDPKVVAGTPLHGCNLFPEDIQGFRETVLEYMDAMTSLGHTLMEGIALSLGLSASYFADRYTREPLTLFRIFNYPGVQHSRPTQPSWGVGEHTDYGLLTILRQDDAGGLQVRMASSWIDAPPIAGSFVCNIGDMLDRLTGGVYRSTPHRVWNQSGRDRLSFPFFFDPNFDAEVKPIECTVPAMGDAAQRWDGSSVHEFQGTYGDYILRKVSKVFPGLRRDLQ